MNIIRLPFFRAIVFSSLILTLVFTELWNFYAFFIISAIYSLSEKILSKINFDKEVGNKFIDIYGLLIVIITMIIVLTEKL
ncbi:hypothetical protein BFG57_09665 [Bacillus solimangrovi]|uniref:Uncharacterized protein n=1 Tax=Bacillus solimangrovi TaxID=1305675 RepID=A0A1E5LJ46_9BACI|nr:hypothetical protein BFG57_09665 [Bacillus solimangrovi]